MKVKDTELHCSLKSVTVSKTTATVTLLLVSEKETIPQVGLQIGYVHNGVLIRKDPTVYWAGIYSAIISSDYNVNIGKAMEIGTTIDLSHYPFIENAFSCDCEIVLYRCGTHDILWTSEKLNLRTTNLSPKIDISLRHLFISERDTYRLRLDFNVLENSWLYDSPRFKIRISAPSTTSTTGIQQVFLPIASASYILRDLPKDIITLIFDVLLDDSVVLTKELRIKPGTSNSRVYAKLNGKYKEIYDMYAKASVDGYPLTGKTSNPTVKQKIL